MNTDHMTTPGRQSFAGVSNRPTQSPSFRDIARLLINPSDKFKGFMELERALVAALLIVAFILITLYAVIIVFMPYIRILSLALLFGSFLHPMKRSLSEFNRRLLQDVRKDPLPLLAGLALPFSVVDKLVELIRSSFCQYLYVIVDFGKTILQKDFTSALAVCTVAITLGIMGGNSLINLVIGTNFIIFMADITCSGSSFSDASLYFLIRSFFLAQICWLNPQIFLILISFVIFWIGSSNLLSICKQKLCSSLGLDHMNDTSFEDSINDTLYEEQNNQRQTKFREQTSRVTQHDISLNTYVRKSYISFVKIFNSMVEALEDYVDTISSACVIGMVAIMVMATTLYLTFQIYSESIYLIERVSIAANALHQNNSELRSWLPAWLDVIHSILDGAVKNTYQLGREWIRNSTRQLINNAAVDDFNKTQSLIIEKQMVEFWDRAYAIWLKNRSNATISSESHGLKDDQNPYDWDRLFDAFQSLDFALCTKILKQNLDTLVSVTDSVIALLKQNLSLVVGIFTATLSLVIGGGNVIMNFILDLIIFITALFYLLCASENQYKPIELFKNIMPKSEPSLISRAKGLKTRNEFINSVDQSINAVFTASLKMMIFHGLSTWLLHRLFELEVVYIPAVISALFGAVPFISPYWASIPACFDLYWSGQMSQALLMLLLATIPSSFVTTSFYSEIKGAGHPYLTGLAIAGGVLVFGIDGVLFGPVLLVTIRLLSLVVVYLMDSCR